MNKAQQNTAVNTHIDKLLHYTEMYSFQMKLTIQLFLPRQKSQMLHSGCFFSSCSQKQGPSSGHKDFI